jgi:hypothetical protein
MVLIFMNCHPFVPKGARGFMRVASNALLASPPVPRATALMGNRDDDNEVRFFPIELRKRA